MNITIKNTEPCEAEALALPVIYPVKAEDLPACLHVIHQSFATVAKQFGLTRENCPKHTSFLPLSYLETQLGWGWHMFGLFAGKALIGYVSLSAEGNIYTLHNLAVLPEYRHRGFGKQLLDHAKAHAKDLGGSVIKIGIIEESTVLKEWYAANGFVHTGSQKYEHLPFTTGYMEYNLRKENET
ncbi:MAG: GNAT family N-acetyltransferase [Clostridia bacterium]|nr:GNAT family N-acetyltransferase [Clostridia bacterium]